MLAANRGRAEIVKLLLDRGAQVDAKRSTDGATALCQASMLGHAEVVRLLLEKGANPNAKNSDGRSALWQASILGHTEVVKLLLEGGAVPDAKNNDGNMALSHAVDQTIGSANQMIERDRAIAAMIQRESVEITLIKERGVGDHFVLKDIMPEEKDRLGRGPQKATVQHFHRSEKFSPNTLDFVLIIGQYYEEDGPLLMPGGVFIGVRDEAWLRLEGGGLEMGVPPTPLQIDPGALFYYMHGAARMLDWSPTLDDLLPSASGSVHRYIGESTGFYADQMKFRGVKFNGTSEDDPLTFALLKDIGYVYLHGKGIVTLQDGTKVELGGSGTQ